MASDQVQDRPGAFHHVFFRSSRFLSSPYIFPGDLRFRHIPENEHHPSSSLFMALESDRLAILGEALRMARQYWLV
jgi:hypothetical protein